jgi:CheY-like chemotaxis protein
MERRCASEMITALMRMTCNKCLCEQASRREGVRATILRMGIGSKLRSVFSSAPSRIANQSGVRASTNPNPNGTTSGTSGVVPSAPRSQPGGPDSFGPAVQLGVRALVLEDDQTTLRSYQRILAKKGVEVIAASTPGEALYVAASLAPDVRPTLAFLDVIVPGLDGPRFVAALRQQPAFEAVPVILVSALTPNVLRDRTQQWGANGFILKAKGLIHIDSAFEGWVRYVGGAGGEIPPASSISGF